MYLPAGLRWWLLCLLALLPALAQPAAGGPAGHAATAVPAVGSGQTLMVGLMEFPPLHSWQGGGPPRGFDVELLGEVARLTGLRLEYRRYGSFSALLDGLKAGEVRVATAIAQTADRANQLRFTRPYASVPQAFVGAAELNSVPSTPDLSGRRLAVTRGHVSESIAIERYPAAARLAFMTVEEALDAVERGDADLVLEARPTLEALIARRPATSLAVRRTYGFPEGHLRLAARLEDAELVRQLDAALAALDPALVRPLLQRWLPLPAPPRLSDAPPLAVAPLRIGFLPGDTPFSLLDAGGQPDGIGIRMMKAMAARLGIPIAGFEPLALADGLTALREGRLDIMLGLTDIAERRDAMSFVGPYRANPLVIISRKQSSVWDLHQLSGQRLAMVQGFFGLPYIRRAYPTIEIVTCTAFDACMDMVEQGRASGALYGLQGAYERLGGRAGSTLQITGTVPGLYDEHNLGVSLARSSLAPRLREALDVVLHEDMPRIEAEWLAEESASRADWRRLRQAGAVLLLLLAAAGATWWWQARRLRAEIARTRAAREESEAYLAFMAHEVRNSLQSVSGAVALLRGSSRPDARQGPVLEALGRSARSTLGLLNGLLDRHRLQAGRLALDLRPDSLQRVLGTVLEEVRPMAQAKGLQMELQLATPLDGWWRVDALRVQQVLRNLLVNAVKFSRRGTIVLRVALEPAARGDDWRAVVADVVDTGVGMDEVTVARIFEGYHSAGGDRPGSGLGLHLCRDLAAALGGTLAVASRPGEGSTFTLRFDVQAAGAAEARADGTLQRLLVVEDSPVYSLLLRQAFENRGVVVHAAESVAQAQEALVASVAGAGATAPAFDAVLSDTRLGDDTVDTLLRFMRDSVRPGVRMPPLIAMSAEFDGDATARLAAAGAADLLTKDGDVVAFADRVMLSLAHLSGT
jgi:signal transduction histidine kinase/ActR/RegA family two-component response regulator